MLFRSIDARIVLFIDDLDRCLPEITLEVLEAIKLYLAIPQIMFVVGLDREVVDGVVVKHYETHGLGKDKARQYLDKIFQVEIQIPPSERQMEDFLEKQIAALNASTTHYWKNTLEDNDRIILESGIRELAQANPRESKRLLNSALLRGRAAVDNAALNPKRDAAIAKKRFAQGIQFFLVQRKVHEVVRKWISNGRNLLQDSESIDWFKQWSEFAIKHPKFIPRSEERRVGKECRL